MKNLPRLATLSILALFAFGMALGAGGSREDPPASAAEETPEQLAAQAYNDGLSNRDMAWQFQKKIDDPALTAEKRAKLEGKVDKAYRQAIKNFERAVENDPGMHQAWGSLGYAYRQTGDYATALEAYDQALTLKPDYAEALEYRGEAYLGLGRMADAQETYGRLADVDAKLADELLSAARSWIEARRAEPTDVKVGELDAFERWVGERMKGAPVASSLRKSRSW